MGLFKRGYQASREEKQRQDEARKNAGKKLWRFFLADDGDEADLRFLTEEPVNFKEHTIKSVRNGKEAYTQYTCTGDNCSLCDDGDKSTYKGAYLVVDRHEYEYTDDKGKKQKGKDQLRLFVQGMKVVSQLDRISSKYGLSNREVTIIRLGKGTQTSYTIERGDEEKLTEKEIRQLLPEQLRDEYDGTMESLYKIVEEQLLMCTADYEEENDEDTEDENDERDGLFNIDDEIEDEEEDDLPFKNEPKSKKKPLGSKKSKPTFKKAQNSLKKNSSAKSLFKKK